MELNEYQQDALKTAVYPREFETVYPALGMNGEAGEVADKVKKIIRDTAYVRNDKGEIVLPHEKRESLALEVGDVLWYCATFAHDIGMTLDEVAKMNVAKLQSRQNRGQLRGSGDYR